MNRRLALGILAAAPLVVLSVLLALPFTDPGSALLLRALNRLTPLQLHYGGGSIAGRLTLDRVVFRSDNLQIELQQVQYRVQPACLWRSVICLARFSVATTTVDVSPATGSEQRAAQRVLADVVFPLALQVDKLELGALSMHWPGGSWQQGPASAALKLGESRVQLDGLRIEQPRLLLAADSQVQFGSLQLDGSLQLVDDWPLQLALAAPAVNVSGRELGDVSIAVTGNMDQLRLQLYSAGALPVHADARLNVRKPLLPFSAHIRAQWQGDQPLLAELADASTMWQTVRLTSPIEVEVSGDVNVQSFSADTVIDALGYENMAVALSGKHRDGLVSLEKLDLRERDGGSAMHGSGQLSLGGNKPVQATLVVATPGMALPRIDEAVSGRLHGSVTVAGRYSAQGWQLAMRDSELQGQVNGLPAQLHGWAALDSSWRVGDSQLQAQLNGADLQLLSDGTSGNARVSATAADLGRWLPGAAGGLTLNAEIDPGGQAVLSGDVQDVVWRDLHVEAATLAGEYTLGGNRKFNLILSGRALHKGKLALKELRLHAHGDAAAISLDVDSEGDVRTALRFSASVAGNNWAGVLQPAIVHTPAGDWTLAQPLSMDWSGSAHSLGVDSHCWQGRQTKLCPGDLQWGDKGASGRLTAAGELAAFSPLLAAGQDVSGQFELALWGDWTVGGAPQWHGRGRISDGQLHLEDNPTEISELSLGMELEGDRISLDGTGSVGGGRTRVTGMLELAPDWHLQLQLKGENNRVMYPPSAQLLLSESLQIDATSTLLDIHGRIDVHEGELKNLRLPEGGVALSPDVVTVDDKGQILQTATPLAMNMDILLAIDDQLLVQTDMLKATLGGELRLKQNPAEPPQLFGQLNVTSGELHAYHQFLQVGRGTVSFSGPPANPLLDLRAEREIQSENIRVGVQVQGRMESMALNVFSEPAMPQAETMSYLLRGRGLDVGAGADGTALALSVASSALNESSLGRELNRIPGLSQVQFGAQGSDEDTAATVSGYIGERIYLSYGVGVYEPVNMMMARLYLRTRLWVEVISRLESSVDLYYSFDLD